MPPGMMGRGGPPPPGMRPPPPGMMRGGDCQILKLILIMNLLINGLIFIYIFSSTGTTILKIFDHTLAFVAFCVSIKIKYKTSILRTQSFIFSV